MGKILGIAIKNYGSLKDIKIGQLYSNRKKFSSWQYGCYYWTER